MINDLKKRMEALGVSQGQIDIAIFWSREIEKELECIDSTLEDFRLNEKTSLYKHRSLIKILGMKSDLWTQELKEVLYPNETNSLTLVVRWEKKKHIFCYLKINDDSARDIIASEHQRLKETIQEYVTERVNG